MERRAVVGIERKEIEPAFNAAATCRNRHAITFAANDLIISLFINSSLMQLMPLFINGNLGMRFSEICKQLLALVIWLRRRCSASMAYFCCLFPHYS